MPEHRTRSKQRIEEIDISPTKLLGDIEILKGELDEARKGSEEYLDSPSARTRRIPELSAPDDRGARARRRPGRRGPAPQGPDGRGRLRSRDRGAARPDRHPPVVRGHRRDRSKAPPPARVGGRQLDRRDTGPAIRPARTRCDRHGARDRAGGGPDRRGDPARLSAPGPRAPAGPRGGRRPGE